MTIRDPEVTSGDQFCGNCGSAVAPSSTECAHCGADLQPEQDQLDELTGDYIPYCRACGVPVSKEEALYCTKCGVTPLCQEHFFPSTRSCSICPTITEAEANEHASSRVTRSPTVLWGQLASTFPCHQCGARLGRGVGYCPNCGTEYEGANADSNYVGFLPRLGAAIIDIVAPILVSGVIIAFVNFPGIFMLIFVSYHAIFTYNLGQTPGKMILGIQVVDANRQKPTLKQIILREVIGKIIVFLVMFIGFIWVIWDPKKRGWHDYIGNTYVVKRNQD
ncbi:MAG: RDD family protein [Chloroflexota bacterium]|nr:RDD family protein [Chloroflexota bacterium]